MPRRIIKLENFLLQNGDTLISQVQNVVFTPKSGDILQVRLVLDGDSVLTDPLVRTAPHTYEQSVLVPLDISEVRWHLVWNTHKALTKVKKISVPLSGNLIPANENK